MRKGAPGSERNGADSRSPNLFWRNGIAWARAKVAGKTYRRSLCTRDRSEALRRIKSFLAEIEQIRFYGVSRTTYDDAVVAWDAGSMGGVSPSTCSRYRTSLRQLDPHFGGMFVDQITKAEVGAFVRARQAKLPGQRAIKNATLKRDLTALSRLLSFCVAQGWRLDNPARD